MTASPSASSFGFVVDDGGPDQKAAGGALRFAASLGERSIDEAAHRARCPSCALLSAPFACVGMIPAPLSAAVEQWLVGRLPSEIETLGGFLLQKAIGDFGYDGALAAKLRAAGRLAAPGPFARHYGPFFRRFVVSSEQLLEELLCAGDIAPAHGLAILMHLGAVEVDGAVPTKLDEGEKLSTLVEAAPTRRARTRLHVAPAASDDASLAGVKGLLAALYAGFVLDADVFVIDPDESPPKNEGSTG